MKAWYNDEMPKFTGYNQASPNMANFEDWGHYTQVVWKDSNKLGCATHHCTTATDPATGSTYKNIDYIVCNYGPAGKFYANLVGTCTNRPFRKHGGRLCKECCTEHLLIQSEHENGW
jgi:hypothetical protein